MTYAMAVGVFAAVARCGISAMPAGSTTMTKICTGFATGTMMSSTTKIPQSMRREPERALYKLL
jgi:hypothetical protein